MTKAKEAPDSTAPAAAAPDAIAEQPNPVEQYEITTEHPDFTGMTLGVQFLNGRGMLNATSFDKRLGRTFEEVVAEFKLLPGYHVRRV